MKSARARRAPLWLLLLLAACSTQAPPRFHSLMPPTAGVRPAAAAALPAWQLLPVSVPPQVDQPQFVVRLADDTLALLEQERWIAPLADEVRAALSEHMAVTLGTPGATPAAGRKDWRIAVDVQRFDSTPGRSTMVAAWSVQSGSAAPVLRCRSVLEQSVGAGIPALAGGHRQAVQRLGAALASALAALDAGRSVECPAASAAS
ncbi:MAG: PqiC family protein [Burkholderiaceae bacterium]